jgi:hypothetical protein
MALEADGGPEGKGLFEVERCAGTERLTGCHVG